MQQNRVVLAIDSDNFTNIAIRYTQNAENAFLIAELNGMDVDSEIPSGTEIMLPLQSDVPVTVASPQTTTAEPTPSALLELLKQHSGTIASTQQLGHVRSGSQIRVNEDGTMEVIGGVVGQDGKDAYEVWLEAGNNGTVQDYLNSLKGEDGQDGAAEPLKQLSSCTYENELVKTAIYKYDNQQESIVEYRFSYTEVYATKIECKNFLHQTWKQSNIVWENDKITSITHQNISEWTIL